MTVKKRVLSLMLSLVLLVTCLCAGLVLPTSAATATLSLDNDILWMLTGRYRTMGAATYTDADGVSSSIPASSITWSIAHTAVATIDATGRIDAKTVGVTTVTGTYNSVSATCELHVVDGSDYVYATAEYTNVGDNLLQNGDFENGTTGWWESSVFSVQDDVGQAGSAGMVLPLNITPPAAGEPSTAKSWYYKLDVAVKPATTYQLSFSYKPAPNTTFYVEGSRFDGPRCTVTLGDDVGEDWVTVTKVFTTGVNYTKRLGYNFLVNCSQSNADTPVVIDNITLYEVTSQTTAETMTLTYDALTMESGQIADAKVWTEPYLADKNNVTWTSSDRSVATVFAGKITAVGAGTATITATKDNLTATCEVTVTGDAALLQNGDFEQKTAWQYAGGSSPVYVAGAGKYDTQVVQLKRNYPVSQAITGLKPNTTYTLHVDTYSSNKYPVVVTVTDGSDVIYTYTQGTSSTWNMYVPVSDLTTTPLNTGITFTTPATLDGDAVLHLAVLKNANDTTAVTTYQPKAGSTGSGPVFGEGEIEDNDDDITDTTSYTAYVDNVRLYESAGGDINLEAVGIGWTGDDDNDGQVTPDTSLVFNATVTNTGTDDLPVGTPLQLAVSADTEVVRTFTYTGGIPAGATVTVTDTEAWTATAGDHMMAVRVNSDWAVKETITNIDQTYQLNLRVAEDTYTPAYNQDIIVDKAGMDRLTLSDDFNTLDSVDTTASGQEGYKWYVTRPWSAPTLTTNDYQVDATVSDAKGTVANGVVTLKAEIPTYAITFNSVDVNTKNGYRYNQGYLEARLRVVRPSENASHEEGIPALWSFTQDKALEAANYQKYGHNDDHWVEMDWLEYWGIRKASYPNGYYTTTFHDSVSDGNTSGYAYSNANAHLKGLGDAEWHVMGWLWEENSVRCFLDGVEVQNLFFDDDASAVPEANAKSTGANDDDAGVFSWINYEAGVLYLGGSKDNPMQLDYIRVWQTSTPDTVSDDMEIDQSSLTLQEGDRQFLTVTAKDDSDLGELTWSSSNPTVATVHGNGEIYARTTGTAVITATNKNGISVMSTVTVTHNLLNGGDFEWYGEPFNNDLLYKNWTSMLNGGAAVEDGSLKIEGIAAATKPARWYSDLPVETGKTYVLTGKTKISNVGSSQTALAQMHFSSYFVKSVSVGDVAQSSVTAVNIPSAVGTWTDFTLTITMKTAEEIKANDNETQRKLNTYYTMAFQNRSNTGTGTVVYDTYFDDLVLTEADAVSQSAYTLTVPSPTGGTVAVSANGTPVASGSAVAPGTTLTVTVIPTEGYRLDFKSFKATYTVPNRKGSTDGSRTVMNAVRVNTEGNFSGATGKEFTFTMPAANTTLNATFEAIATAMQPAATLGTAVYKDTESGTLSGIRFLNRLHYTRLTDDGKVYVMYNGVETEVTDFGALLKRTSNTGELTLEAYQQHKSDSSATRIWKTSAMRNGDVYLVDYTDTYMDFSITMTSSVANRASFLDRDYTVCAYVTLKIDEETSVTLYTTADDGAISDSALSAWERM